MALWPGEGALPVTDADAAPAVVRMEGITRRFPGVVALSGVDFDVRPGEVHVLLGENGAGKSTLIKVLSGCLPADEGRILIADQPVLMTSPRVPLERGLRFIYQELSLVPELDVARNIFLGVEPTAELRSAALLTRLGGLVDKPALYRRARELLERFHLTLDPHQVVSSLSVAHRKLVEIARALVTMPRVIVMDEPTDVLEDQSRANLFDVIRRLRSDHDVGFVYISHRYQEVHELGDRVTVLRDGKRVGTYDIRQVTLDELISLMIGGQVGQQYPLLPQPRPQEALRVEGLTRRGVLNDVSFSVAQGEVVAVTGLMGAGKTELARAIAGIDRSDAGRVFVEGKAVSVANPARAIRAGIGYLTEDRKTEGLVLDHSIRDNYALPSLGRLSSWGLLRQGLMDREMGEYVQRLGIKAPGVHWPAGQLSGGNQQKVVIARWLGARCKVLLFDEPTRGVDIKGRSEVYQVMAELLAQGVGIVLCTSDYAEALAMGHRILVLRPCDERRTARSSLRREYRHGEASEEDLLRAAIGATGEKRAA